MASESVIWFGDVEEFVVVGLDILRRLEVLVGQGDGIEIHIPALLNGSRRILRKSKHILCVKHLLSFVDEGDGTFVFNLNR